MGEDLRKRYPWVYKYGKLRKCIIYSKKGQLVKAYEELMKTFNLENLKKQLMYSRYFKKCQHPNEHC